VILLNSREVGDTLVCMPVIHALGASVHVDLAAEIEVGVFTTAWSRCLQVSQAGDGNPVDADPGGAGGLATIQGDGSMTQVTQAITRQLIAERRGELLMLHAGAVCHPDTGSSIAYAAPGGTGKTTLTRVLGRRYGYLTDETVGIEPRTWEIKPYPKPLSTRTPEGGYPKSELGPDELGLVRAHPHPRLTTLAILRRTPGRDCARISRFDLFDAITALVPETSSLPAMDRPLHLLADLHDELDGVWLLEFGEAEQLTDWIDDQLAAS